VWRKKQYWHRLTKRHQKTNDKENYANEVGKPHIYESYRWGDYVIYDANGKHKCGKYLNAYS